MSFEIPILFVIFNRPDTTQQVFDEIRKQQPKSLYVAADGPRKTRLDDQVKCNETRAIISKIDWECNVKLLYRNENLGCGKAVSSAITWFFEQEEMGIVLEDDCLPHPDFFLYCKELLIKYKDNNQIKWIAGNNCSIKSNSTASSYYFSAYNHVWGWASWRRVWKDYHYNITDFPKNEVNKKVNHYFNSLGERLYWKNRYQIIKNEKNSKKRRINTWDYQATFSMWMKDGLSILPQKNLVTNIGFGSDSTHSFNNKLQFKTESIFPLIHNNNIFIDHEADLLFYKSIIFKPLWKSLITKIILFIENL